MPFPLLAALPSILGGLSSIFGGASRGAREDRLLNDQSQLSRDRLNQERFRTNEALPGSRLQTSTRASMVRHASPVQFHWNGPGSGERGEVPRFSGGFANPDLIDPRTRQQADDVLNQLIQRQMGRQEAPPISATPREGVGSRILGGLALGSSILGGLGSVRGRRQGTQPPDYSDQY